MENTETVFCELLDDVEECQKNIHFLIRKVQAIENRIKTLRKRSQLNGGESTGCFCTPECTEIANGELP